MKRSLIGLALISMAFAMPALAADLGGVTASGEAGYSYNYVFRGDRTVDGNAATGTLRLGSRGVFAEGFALASIDGFNDLELAEYRATGGYEHTINNVNIAVGNTYYFRENAPNSNEAWARIGLDAQHVKPFAVAHVDTDTRAVWSEVGVSADVAGFFDVGLSYAHAFNSGDDGPALYAGWISRDCTLGGFTVKPSVEYQRQPGGDDHTIASVSLLF